ncbi:MAG: carboxymuconolactone decarboxylase family protein [Bacillota bacterium]
MANYPAFIGNLEKTDPQLFQHVRGIFDAAMAPGELDAKTKILLAMALDALAGADAGVKSLAQIARKMGVTDGQIAEALRIAYSVAGNKLLATALAAFEE